MIMNLVEVKEFSFAYPECSRKVLDHANLKIEEGTLNVICGRSGCGKSTLLRQLKTVLASVGKSEGEIFYRGMPLSGIDHRTQSQEIGFVMQNPDNQIVTDKVWHELSFGLKAWDMTMRPSGCGLRRWPAILVSISGFIKMSQSCQEGRSRS